VGVGGLAVLVRPDRLKVWGWIRVSVLCIGLSGCEHTHGLTTGACTGGWY